MDNSPISPFKLSLVFSTKPSTSIEVFNDWSILGTHLLSRGTHPQRRIHKYKYKGHFGNGLVFLVFRTFLEWYIKNISELLCFLAHATTLWMKLWAVIEKYVKGKCPKIVLGARRQNPFWQDYSTTDEEEWEMKRYGGNTLQ